ncbi:hypothetical protein EJB05_41356, partial [Eragrostis curvula]
MTLEYHKTCKVMGSWRRVELNGLYRYKTKYIRRGNVERAGSYVGLPHARCNLVSTARQAAT